MKIIYPDFGAYKRSENGKISIATTIITERDNRTPRELFMVNIPPPPDLDPPIFGEIGDNGSYPSPMEHSFRTGVYKLISYVDETATYTLARVI